MKTKNYETDIILKPVNWEEMGKDERERFLNKLEITFIPQTDRDRRAGTLLQAEDYRERFLSYSKAKLL